jgi:glycosyltransferase involved in cell wall biosynthesis
VNSLLKHQFDRPADWPASSDMRVILTVADLQPENGGTTRCISALAGALAELKVEVEIMALEYGPQASKPMLPPKSVRAALVPCRGAIAGISKWSGKFRPTLVKHCQPASGVILHDNGVWLPTNHITSRVSVALGIPRVVSPHGMLTAWSLHYRGWKKKIAWWLYQRRDLQSAQVLHATSPQEAGDFRAAGLTQPIAVIPNGVTLPPENRKSKIGNRKSEVRTVLFLGRIHPNKGLLDLIRAWAQLKPSGWRVVVAGNDEDGHVSELKAEIRKLKLETRFKFAGPVDGVAKWELYRAADIFALPTKSENFGIVIAEALACGVPVITTKGAPWEALVTQRCGWWVEVGVEPLIGALREAFQLSDEQRREMGRRGQQLVEQNYTWPAAAQKMLAVYEWLAAGGDRPDCLLEN